VLRIRQRLSYANVVATLALFVALGGSATAALVITGKNVKNGSLTGSDLKNGSVGSVDVKDNTLLAKDFKAGQIPAGPQGPPGTSTRLYTKFERLTVPASGLLRQNIECDSGDVTTGGGYFLNSAELTDSQRNVEVVSDGPISDFGREDTGWDIGIYNKTATERNGFGYVRCADLTP
jgi:hypothetical protein